MLMTVDKAIRTDAPPKVVWSVAEDVESWPEWLPTMESVNRMYDGPFELCSTVLIKQRTLPEAEWSVTEFVRGERFSWETLLRGMRMVASHEKTPAGIGTMNRLKLEASGLPLVILWPLLRVATGWALSKENRELKSRCEAIKRAKIQDGRRS